jgi:hypothetical protein
VKLCVLCDFVFTSIAARADPLRPLGANFPKEECPDRLADLTLDIYLGALTPDLGEGLVDLGFAVF